MIVSEKLITAIKLNPLRHYRIAQKAELHPSTLSQIICGIRKVKENDPRVVRLCEVLGLRPEDGFDNEEVNIYGR
jgi:hypothetical protein